MSHKPSNNRLEFSCSIKIPTFVSFIMEQLHKNGFNAFIVGGAIRDALLERKALDWDITTNATVDNVKSIFKNIRQFALKHETITLVNSGEFFEITAMKGGGGINADIYSDLCHRDFTINAMAYDEKKSIVLDPHNGASDIKRKIVKAVNDPAERFREDPLRMLRAVRIAGELGFKIEEKTLDNISSHSYLLKMVSVERIRDELIRIILCEKPSKLLEILQRTGVLQHVVPELLEGYGMTQNSWHSYTVFEHVIKTVDNVPPNHLLRFAALLHDVGKPRVKEDVNGTCHFYNHEKVSSSMTKEIMERLRFSNEDIKKVTNLISNHMIDYNDAWSDGAIRRLIRRAGMESIGDLLLLKKADIIAHGKVDLNTDPIDHLEARINKIKKDNTSINISDLAISGKKIMDTLDLAPGPDVGNILEKLLEIIIDNPEFNSEEKLTGILQAFRKEQK